MNDINIGRKDINISMYFSKREYSLLAISRGRYTMEDRLLAVRLCRARTRLKQSWKLVKTHFMRVIETSGVPEPFFKCLEFHRVATGKFRVVDINPRDLFVPRISLRFACLLPRRRQLHSSYRNDLENASLTGPRFPLGSEQNSCSLSIPRLFSILIFCVYIL